MLAELTQPNLALIREAAQAGFHLTPPATLALLDLLDAAVDMIVAQRAAAPEASDPGMMGSGNLCP